MTVSCRMVVRRVNLLKLCVFIFFFWVLTKYVRFAIYFFLLSLLKICPLNLYELYLTQICKKYVEVVLSSSIVSNFAKSNFH